MCRFVVHSVPTILHLGAGEYRPEAYCEEHGMPLAMGTASPNNTTLCAIGRIEEARDAALKAIAEAQRIHWVDAVSTKDYKVP